MREERGAPSRRREGRNGWRKLQKTTIFGVRASKNHHFSDFLQKTTGPPFKRCKKH
jgi:hypothetical protein